MAEAQRKSRRTSGVVVPRALKFRHKLAAWLIAMGVRALSATWRLHYHDPHRIFDSGRGPMIFALWHNRLALSMKLWERWGSEKAPAAGLVALISASHDGGILSRALQYFGVEAVRGSSSRRGPQALLELTSWTERGYHIAITPDGPRGPRYVVQEGIIALAQVSSLPILPVSTRARPRLRLRSWDRFEIPLPFARCDVCFGALLRVPRDASDEGRAESMRELERRMHELTQD